MRMRILADDGIGGKAHTPEKVREVFSDGLAGFVLSIKG